MKSYEFYFLFIKSGSFNYRFMKKRIRSLVVSLLVGLVFPVQAQYDTGDEELNKSLISIDVQAKADFGAFKMELSSSSGVEAKKIDYLSIEIGMSAGDIYMTIELAKITKKSIDDVVKVYSVHKEKGWGVMAKELGIKPGSPEFHALKGNAKNKGNSKGKGKGKGNN